MVFRHLNSSLCWLFICVKQPNNKANVKPARNGDITTKVKKNSTTEKNPRNHVTDITRMSLARSGMRPFANPVGPHTVPHVKMSGTDSAFLLSIKLLCLSFFCSGFQPLSFKGVLMFCRITLSLNREAKLCSIRIQTTLVFRHRDTVQIELTQIGDRRSVFLLLFQDT